jgi:hypothetical protein
VLHDAARQLQIDADYHAVTEGELVAADDLDHAGEGRLLAGRLEEIAARSPSQLELALRGLHDSFHERERVRADDSTSARDLAVAKEELDGDVIAVIRAAKEAGLLREHPDRVTRGPGA